MLLCRLVDVMVKHIDAHQRQVGGGFLWFFDQAHDAALPVQLGHAILLRPSHPRQDDLAVPFALGKLADQFRDAPLDDVVSQEHHETLVAQKIPADLDGVGQAQGLILGNVGDLDAPAPALVRRPS